MKLNRIYINAPLPTDDNNKRSIDINFKIIYLEDLGK